MKKEDQSTENAAEITIAKTNSYKAEVVEIIKNDGDKLNPNYKLKIFTDDKSGRIVETGYGGTKYNLGDKVFVTHTTEKDGYEYYNIGEYVRHDSLIITLFLFISVVIIIFGKKGLKSLLSLSLSLCIIFYILLPLTLKGYNPVLIASLISVPLLFSVMFITHGKNRVTYSAMIGCSISIFITIIISYITIIKAKITGFTDETSTYLYYNTDGNINFPLLVIASIIIGVIGVVDDGAITQAGIVAELKNANSKLSNFEYYKRAMRVGSDHGGAMVNTLVLAYIGSALPILLLAYTTNISKLEMINKEIISTEILRSLIGSIGLLLAIPLTTLIAIKLVKPSDGHHSHH
jgi:uncharacterized membrane protein